MELIKAIEKEVLKEVFKKADEEGTGKLSFSQMKALLLGLGLEESVETDKTVQMICKMADVNGDKMIDSEEFINFLYDNQDDPKEKWKQAFRVADTNGDGLVCKKELGEFLNLGGLGGPDNEEAVGMTITLFDWDSDGKLDYEEFCDMMNM
eukprot:GFUD01005650.1.p1 GENE.GFUD01005650.1~~GFUD01005650.1.p1  ORF type:complete len:173 (-),score=57.81 GFUD01005650.1:113-565(-)